MCARGVLAGKEGAASSGGQVRMAGRMRMAPVQALLLMS